MAAAEIRRASAFIDNDKIAELESSDYSENTNGEQGHMQEGVGGISVGNPEVEMTFNVIRPVSPKAGLVAMERALRTQAPVVLSYKTGSTLTTGTFKCMSKKYTGDSRTGMLKGVFVFRNADNPVES